MVRRLEVERNSIYPNNRNSSVVYVFFRCSSFFCLNRLYSLQTSSTPTYLHTLSNSISQIYKYIVHVNWFIKFRHYPFLPLIPALVRSVLYVYRLVKCPASSGLDLLTTGAELTLSLLAMSTFLVKCVKTPDTVERIRNNTGEMLLCVILVKLPGQVCQNSGHCGED